MTDEELLRLKEDNQRILMEDIRSGSCVLRAYPVFVGLATDSRCNLKCIMCQQRLHDATGIDKLPEIKEEYLIKFAEQVFPTAKTLQLNPSGEPLMSRLSDLELELAERFGVRLEMHTNGTLLDVNADRFRRIVGNASTVFFSIDSPVKETYESIRKGADFDRVVENLRRFQSLRMAMDGRLRPSFFISMVLMKRNLHELPQMVRFANDMGADCLSVTRLIVYQEALRQESLDGRTAEVSRIVSQSLEYARRLNIQVRIFPLQEICPLEQPDSGAQAASVPEKGKKPLPRCFYLWERVYLDGNADICTCCEGSHPVAGSMRTHDFRDIWNNGAYQAMRRTFLGGPLHPLCGPCATEGYFHDIIKD